MQAGHGTSQRPVDVELDKFGPVHSGGPGRVDLRDHTSFEFEDRIGGVIGRHSVRGPVLVHALRDVGGADAGHGLDGSKQFVEHVAPVCEHVEDDPATVLGSIVPGRSLGGLPVPLEDPVAELPADGQDATEESAVHESRQLPQAGEEQLVLDDPVHDPGCPRGTGQVDRRVQVVGKGLLAVDVLASRYGRPDGIGAQRGQLRIEVDVDLGIGQHGVEVGRGPFESIGYGKAVQLVGVASDQDRLWPDGYLVAPVNTALLANRQDRAQQVLVAPHPASHAIHGDGDSALVHSGDSMCRQRCSRWLRGTFNHRDLHQPRQAACGCGE